MIDALSGERAVNPRLRKIIYLVETVRRAGADPVAVALEAQTKAKYAGMERSDAYREAIVRNRTILERLGCLGDKGMAALEPGKLPRFYVQC